MNNKYPECDNKKFYRNAGILIGVLLIIAILLATFRGCENNPSVDNPADTTVPGIVYDDGAVQGGWDEADTDKIIASLNEKVEEGMINISMNTSPNFNHHVEIPDKAAIPYSVPTDPAHAENSVLGVQWYPLSVRVDVFSCRHSASPARTVFVDL